MKKTNALFLIVLTLIFSAAAFAQSRVGGRVVEVLDGKTVVLQTYSDDKLTAELQYIEVPETGQPLFQIAKDHLQTLVLNKKVEFRARGFTNNKTIGQLLLNGVDVSQQMIRDGAAWYAVLQKDAQDYNESVVYQNNEARAKSEKLGIWSVAGLKPSWEIRAETEANRRQEETKRAREAEEAAQKTAATDAPKPKKRPTVRQLNDESKMFSQPVETPFGALPENASLVGGLFIAHNQKYNFGMVATPAFDVEVLDKDNRQAVKIGILYVYGDDRQGKREKIYMVVVESVSRDWKFLKFNDLNATGDAVKVNFGKAKRVAYNNDSVMKEILSYRVKRSDLEKIANADNLSVKVGTYSTKVSSDIQLMLVNFLNVAE